MELLENIIKTDSDRYSFVMDTDIAVVKFVIPIGFAHLIQRGGYAHLIEHMIIQENKKYLTYLEQNGIQFNAETKDNITEYIFIDLKNSLLLRELEDGVLREIFNAEFLNESLEVEKKTILQEHLLLSNNFEKNEVNYMIGSENEIENFKLEKLSEIKNKYYDKYKTFIFGKEEINNKSMRTKLDIKNWTKMISFDEVDRNKDSVTLVLNSNIYAEILAYFTRILFCDYIKDFKFSVNRKQDKLEIIIEGDTRWIKDVIKYKENSFNYYYILLTSFKFLCGEVTYVTKYLNEDFDINEAYTDYRWEDLLCEKILE